MEERRVDREIQGELKFGEKLSAVQGIIGVSGNLGTFGINCSGANLDTRGRTEKN